MLVGEGSPPHQLELSRPTAFAVGRRVLEASLLRFAKYSDNYLRSVGILPAVSGASRSRPARGQDAHATAGETPSLRKQFVSILCNSQ
jgi:hypothetical protein